MTLTAKKLLDQRFSKRRDTRFPRYTYLGAAAKQPLMDDWIKLLKGVTKYVDPVAGSNNQPYAIGKAHGVPVLVNDGSYYSHCIACGLFHRKKSTNLKSLAHHLVAAQEHAQEGMFTEYARSKFRKKLACYIDGLLLSLDDASIKPEHAQFARACIGKTLMTLCSFRSVNFSPTPKIKNEKSTTQVLLFAQAVMRYAYTVNDFRTPGEAWFGDARRFIKNADLEGATVSFDPAWPFASERNAPQNPYHFYRQVGDVLRQRKHKEIPFWKDPDNPKAVTKEFTKWITICFDRGADQVFAWNQDSNDPSKKLLKKTLKQRFRVKEIMNIVKGRITGGKEFEDYVLHIRAD